jgi:two-component sensor histidine kinase
MSNEQVQNETSDGNATLLTCLINTIRCGIGLAGGFEGDVVVTSNLFNGELVRDRSTGRSPRRSTAPEQTWKETASMKAIKKETHATQDFDRLKVRMKSTWMTGDHDFSPTISEGKPSGFSGGSESDREAAGLMSVVVRRLTPSYEVVDVLARPFESMARSLAESQAEAARYREELRQKEFNEEKLRSLLTRSRLDRLISEINPHFLFNALNTIGVLIEENPEAAHRFTIKMANLFRQTLRASERKMVSLHEELSFVQDYLEVEKARFGERLRVEQTVSVANAKIPCFTLQLLIENAIKHGASPKIGTTTIRILVLQEKDRVQIRVSDDGVGMPKDALDHILEKGYGLRNLIDRLNILYPSEFSWHVESEFQKGTVVSLQLPFFPSVLHE